VLSSQRRRRRGPTQSLINALRTLELAHRSLSLPHSPPTNALRGRQMPCLRLHAAPGTAGVLSRGAMAAGTGNICCNSQWPSLTSACMHCLPAPTCQRYPFKLRQSSNTHGRFIPTQPSCSSIPNCFLCRATPARKATLCFRRLRPVMGTGVVGGCGPSFDFTNTDPRSRDNCAHPYRGALTLSERLLEVFRICLSRMQCNFQRFCLQRSTSGVGASCVPPCFWKAAPFVLERARARGLQIPGLRFRHPAVTSFIVASFKCVRALHVPCGQGSLCRSAVFP